MNENDFDLIIEPNRQLTNVAQELWRYKDLFYFLALRDFKVRYKQTVIGSSWAFLRPTLTMIVFTIVFGKIAGLPSQSQTPYPIMVFVAMLPWYFFASSFQEGSNALVANSNMISKVYFPRIIVPISSLFVNFVDFLISFGILLLLMLYYRVSPTLNILAMPFFLLLTAALTIGATLWMSALNVSYRDIRYVIPFIVQSGLYMSPVGFSSNIVAEDWRLLYSLNPMTGVIDGFRWCFLGSSSGFYWPSFVISISTTLLLLTTGYAFFKKTERKFADII